ncbi:hypothetical protein EGW08_017019 [Elysia chlorotica]|uniref:EGF-like domain-containing protein n=1 Tax=Elysia chlorotica TaxID=188477 RepID=A0A433T118_ELYCH|nr:hypothetical protein EGW08_017019 [Elysia chlorotica]
MKGLLISPTFPVLLSLIASFVTSLEQPSGSLPSACHFTCETSMNGTATFDFCESHSTLKIVGRCCLNDTDLGTLVLGVDLQKCGLSEGQFSAAISNMSNLMYISLEGNNMKRLQNFDFHQNTNIEYLSLPPNLSCPGGNGTWLMESSDANSTICQFEQNACDVHNVSCPSNSHCVHSGVDMVECLCNDGYYGYKCLEQGVFPITPFLIGITVPTVVLCIFLYVTQRRHVIQQRHKKK